MIYRVGDIVRLSKRKCANTSINIYCEPYSDKVRDLDCVIHSISEESCPLNIKPIDSDSSSTFRFRAEELSLLRRGQ